MNHIRTVLLIFCLLNILFCTWASAKETKEALATALGVSYDEFGYEGYAVEGLELETGDELVLLYQASNWTPDPEERTNDEGIILARIRATENPNTKKDPKIEKLGAGFFVVVGDPGPLLLENLQNCEEVFAGLKKTNNKDKILISFNCMWGEDVRAGFEILTILDIKTLKKGAITPLWIGEGGEFSSEFGSCARETSVSINIIDNKTIERSVTKEVAWIGDDEEFPELKTECKPSKSQEKKLIKLKNQSR